MKRLHFSLLILIFVMLVGGGITLAAMRSHEQTVLGNARWKAFYRGLGWNDGSGITGRRYYAFTVDDSPFRFWRISYWGGDYGDAVCRYPDGSLALEGECRIEFAMNEAYPLLDDLRNARSYSPDGELTATVVDGTGRAMLFYADGTLNWDTHYVAGERTIVRHFDEDRTLVWETKFPDSRQSSDENER